MKYLVLDVGNLSDKVLEPDEVLDIEDEVEDLVQLENAVREVTIRDVAASASRIAAESADEYEQQNGRSARHADPVRL